MAGRHPLTKALGLVAPGESISAEQENILRRIATQQLDLVDCIQDSTGIRQARPTVSGSEDELYWCILMEAHPGQGQCFDLLVGTWCPVEHQFRFDCDAEEFETGIDFHYGVPYPEEPGARGWFKRMPSAWTTSGYIYVCVSLDCESPGECGEEGDALPCGTPESDPCSEEA